MIKEIDVEVGRRTVQALEYTLYAFSTDNGVFTLTGSDTLGNDTFKNLTTREFHTWQRSQIYEWFKQGKITPIEKAITILWY